MASNRQFRTVKNKFVATIIALAVMSVLSLGFVLYQANTVSLENDISSRDLETLVEDNPAVAEYLAQEKDYEAHFITIANLVQLENQKDITNSLILVLLPILIIAGLAGYLIANHLLKPVKESFDSQERFMQDAAHELRNPLAAISVAIENAPKEQAKTDLVKTLRRQTKRLVGIVEDMLFLERRRAGDKIDETNVSDLLQDVIEDLTPYINSKSLKLVSKIEQDIVIKIDSQDFIKLSRNLIENAIKYSPDKKTVKVTLNRKNRVELIVQDQGRGIPEAEIDNIGNRFYRAKNVGNISGTGLGIAIVNKVLNSYGGTLEIKSKLNQGTTVKAAI